MATGDHPSTALAIARDVERRGDVGQLHPVGVGFGNVEQPIVEPHFSVNRMLAAEAYRQRMEKGLSFIEFNYQILQAYDFLVLYQRYGCRLQMGGADQWGNITAGLELIRRRSGGGAANSSTSAAARP